jgi:23S rRNA-/tRNA-specific pseudouridylate synthase
MEGDQSGTNSVNNEGLVWLQLSPKTGRTHQLRKLCADELRAPLHGDAKYGANGHTQRLGMGIYRRGGEEAEGAIEGEELFLHCRSITLHALGSVMITAPLPAHMARVWGEQGWDLDR